MKRIFVCSPFRGNTDTNAAFARDVSRRIALAGDAPFAPHLLLPQLLDDDNDRERMLGTRCGLAWLAVADEVRIFGELTAGMTAEIAEAFRLGKAVRQG